MKFFRLALLLVGIVLGLLIGTETVTSQVASSKSQADSRSDVDAVAAMLGKQPITEAEIDFHLGRQAGGEHPELSRLSRSSAIQLIALQRQALQTLRKLKLAAKSDEVQSWIAANETVESGKREYAEIVSEICERFGVKHEVYLDQVAFRLSWRRYLAEHLTEKNLARHFKNQTARFDGTKFKIWMLSLATPVGQSEERIAAEKQLGEFASDFDKQQPISEIRATAAKRSWLYTDERWVRGLGDLETRAVDQLLKLKVNELSPVFHTAGGVHIICLRDMEDGDRELPEVKAAVRMHMLEFLLEHLASQSRPQLTLRSIE